MFLIAVAIVVVACMSRGSRRHMFRARSESVGTDERPRRDPRSRIEERFADWHRKVHEAEGASEAERTEDGRLV